MASPSSLRFRVVLPCLAFRNSDWYGARFWEMANAGNNIDITLLSGGIYEAMITTVGGLIVGIAAMFAYNYLVVRVDKVVGQMEARTMDFMDLLNEPVQNKIYGVKRRQKYHPISVWRL